MVSLQITPSTSVVLHILLTGVVAQDGWGVKYTPKSICALKGSTVIIGCTYTYPLGFAIKKSFWSIRQVTSTSEPPDLSLDLRYQDRVQYLGDKQQNCTLSLRDVTEEDQCKYYFRFITYKADGKFQDKNGVQLFVTDLQVETPEEVVEGDDVTLTCKTTCNLTGPSYIWYKNGVSLSSNTKALNLKTVSSEHAASYSCAVLGQSHSSSAVILDVRYPPKKVSVSINPSGEILEGSSVTLTCSSDANPPVQNYTWFKEGGTSPVASGQSYSFNLNTSRSEMYYCVAQNEHGVRRSAALPLNPKRFSMISYVAAGISLCGVAALLFIAFWKRRNKQNMKSSANASLNVYSDNMDETYTALDPSARSSNVYHTLTAIHPSRPDDTYTALDLHPSHPDDTYTALDHYSRCPDDTYTALDRYSRCPDDTYTALDLYSRLRQQS
ncbi:B-cell receptor CD22-like isoform X2 [Electrophorus electricus]|uniref:B-cell receptor CD22-like isoform X2 n=1 Tax=Electrophorus electricus TaxID=8005 RepID=UPI0015CFF248|nr:B-cell receptor CD22-like isoform X2 [Electrophorus electricus]